jgi:5'-3' exonuclease
MRLLIDLDGIIFRCMLATKDQNYYHQLRACYTTVERILDSWNNPDYLMALSGSDNFRKKLYPEYKANRDPNDRPRYLHEVREYFIKYFGAIVADGMEADDLVAEHINDESVVISNDKDYLQIPGTIYNPWKNEAITVTQEMADLNFWVQVCTGDQSDNVPGLQNSAKAHWTKPPCYTKDTATKLLQGLSREQMKDTVMEEFRKVYGEGWFEKFDLSCNLLFLRRANHSSYYSYYL